MEMEEILGIVAYLALFAPFLKITVFDTAIAFGMSIGMVIGLVGLVLVLKEQFMK